MAIPSRWRRSHRLAMTLRARAGGRILAGPFEGLAYGERSHGSAYWPKLLGTYERELYPAIEATIARGFDRALVAGAAEGYYAVGLAARVATAQIVAWEADPGAREMLRALAQRNGVEARVEVRGLCDFGELATALDESGRAFLLADLEGGEAILLDPVALPRLTEVEMLIETHEAFLPGVESRLEARFASSHSIEWIDPRPRSAREITLPGIPTSFTGSLEQLLSERRPKGIRWLHLRPVPPVA